jgi:hypothetical protein
LTFFLTVPSGIREAKCEVKESELLSLFFIFHYILISTFTYVLTKLVICYLFYVSRAPMHLPCTLKKQLHPLMIAMVILFRENSHGKLKTKGF